MADKIQNNHHKIAILGIIDSRNMQHLYKNVSLQGCKIVLIVQPSFAMVPHLEKSNINAKSSMATTSLQNCYLDCVRLQFMLSLVVVEMSITYRLSYSATF